MKLLIAKAVTAATLVLAAVPSSAATDITPEQFVARIERARFLAVRGQGAPSPALLREVRAVLGLPVDVAFPWGTLRIADDPALLELSGRSAADFRFAVAHLEELENEVLETEDAAPRDGDQIRAALNGAFDGITTRRSWIQVARQRAGEAFTALIERIARATASGIGKIAAIALLVGLVALALLLLRLRLRWVPERALGERGGGPVRPDWRLLAARAESRGDLEAAVRAHYQILLEELARRGIVEDEPSLTAGECRAAVAGTRPGLYPVVADATDAFERVAYGHTEPRADHVERLRSATEATRRAA